MEELKTIADIVKEFVPAVILAAITAFVTVRLSIRQFRSERWWERKADAYSRIVEALHTALVYCEELSDESLTGNEISEDYRQKLIAEYSDAVRELKKANSIGEYIVSDKVAAALKKLHGRSDLDWHKTATFEFYDHRAQGYAEALAEIRRLAKADLRVR